jgi:hypothetical protein
MTTQFTKGLTIVEMKQAFFHGAARLAGGTTTPVATS